MRHLLAATVTAAACAAATLVAPVAHAAPAADRNPCSPGPWVTVKKLHPHVVLRKNGNDVVYNNTADPVTRTLVYGHSHTYQVQKSWEVGASAGTSWSVVSASVSAKYGRTYTTSDQVSRSESTEMQIRPRWTGWTQLVVYRHPIVWTKYRDTWNGSRCKVHVIARARWAPPKHQMVPTTKKGHRYPS